MTSVEGCTSISCKSGVKTFSQTRSCLLSRIPMCTDALVGHKEAGSAALQLKHLRMVAAGNGCSINRF